MPPKYNSESEETSEVAESSDNFQVVPSADEDDLLKTEEEVENDELIPSDVQSNVEEETPSLPHPLVTFLLKAIRLMLLPFCKIFFAPAAQKTFIKTTVMVVTISCIIMTSMFAYILFYNQYVPPITHVQPIWFHYTTHAAQGPYATVNVVSGKSVPLRHEQVYDVFVQLHVPTSDVNFDIGNFMVNVELQTSNGSSIERSSRPSILRYQSRSQRVMRVIAKALPLLVGLSEESQVITTKLIDSFTEQKHQAVNKVEISISNPRIQIYDAKLMILAKFHGLRYYMYYHRIMTALTFIFMFAAIEFIFATIAWKTFGESAWHKLYVFLADHELSEETLAIDDQAEGEKDSESGSIVHSVGESEKSD